MKFNRGDMNLKLVIPAIFLVLIAVALLVFGLSSSSVQSYDVQSLLSIDPSQVTETEGIFQGFLYEYDEKTDKATISNDNPYKVGNAKTIRVLIGENTQTPQLYLGAKIFVYGVFNAKNQTITANKIEASCPSKEMDKLPE